MPEDLERGRIAFALRPDFEDAGQRAIAERWSNAMSAEVWRPGSAATPLAAGELIFPLNAALAGQDDIVFPADVITERLEHFLTDLSTPVLPLIVADSTLEIGDLIAHFMPEGLPYGGRVVERRDDPNSNQSLLLLEPDLFSAYDFIAASETFFEDEGLLSEAIVLRIGDPLPPLTSAATGSGRPRLPNDAGLAAQALSDPLGLFEITCSGGVPVLTLSPSVSLIPFDADVFVQVQVTGLEVECKFKALGAKNSRALQRLVRFAQGPAANAISAVLGTKVEPSPLGAIKLNLKSPESTRFGVLLGVGVTKGLRFEPILPGLLTGLGFEGLDGLPISVEAALAGDAGVSLKVSAIDLKDSLLGFVVRGFVDSQAQIGAEGKFGAFLKLGVKVANGAAVFQNKAKTEASAAAGLFASVEVSEIFNKIVRFILGSRKDLDVRLNLTLIELKVQPGYTAGGVTDDGMGSGSFAVQRDAGFFAGIIPGDPIGQLSFAGSTVFNDFNNDVTYAVTECAIRSDDGNRILSPVIGCRTNGFFCNQIKETVAFCLPADPEAPDDGDPLPDDPQPPPVAIPDQYVMAKNATLTTIGGLGEGVLANDTFIASDRAVLFLPPSTGTLLTFLESGNFTYKPPVGFSGRVEFDYRIEGNDAGTVRLSNSAIVTIDVVNSEPVANDDFFELPAGVFTLTVPAPGVLANDTDPNFDPLTAELISAPIVGELRFAEDGSFTYIAPPDFSGSVSFWYRANDGDTNNQTSPAAEVTISRAAPPPGCANPDDRCPLDDLTVFEFAACPGHFGGESLICEQASTTVTFGSLPPELRGQVTVVDEVDPSELEAGTRIFYFELPLPQAVAEDRSVVLPSRDSFLLRVTLPDGSFGVVRLGDAAPAVSNVEGTPRLVEGGTAQFAVEGQTVAEVVIPDVGAVSGDADEQAVLGSIAGLESTIVVPAAFERFTTLIYVSDDDELSSPVDPKARGFIIERPVGAGTPVNDSFESPLLPPALLPFIEAAGGINPLQPIIVTQTRSQFPVTTVFPPDALEPTLHAAQVDGPEVAVGVGVGLSVPLAGLTPPAAVCPARPSGVRCNAGMQEQLLSTNQNGTIRRFSAIDGTSAGTFAEFPGFVADNAWKAMQAPDNCIVVSSQTLGLFMYDSAGTRIRTDGMGNAVDPGMVRPLISSLDVGVRGFTFHAPDESSHHLYVALPTEIVRYDYSQSGTTVLSGRSVVVSEPAARFNDIVIIDGLIYATDEAPDSTALGEPADLVRVYSLEGHDLGVLLDDLVTPYQIVELFDEGIGVANFGTNELRITDKAGNDRRRYLLDDGNAATSEAPRGLWPLRNGNYISGGRNGLGISAVNRHDGTLTQRGLANTERFIGPACLP